jgi:hypothetical protein
MARIKVVNGVVVDLTPEEEAAWNAEFGSTPKNNYKEQRQLEYPPINDYIDGVVKGDQAQIQAYIDACLAVKAKYPKPDTP